MEKNENNIAQRALCLQLIIYLFCRKKREAFPLLFYMYLDLYIKYIKDPHHR